MTRRDAFKVALGGVLLSLGAPGGLGAQTPSAAAPAAQATPGTSGTQGSQGLLSIAGDVSTPLSLTVAEFKLLPRTKVEVKAEDGTLNMYEGVLVGELLKRAGVPLGSQLRGNMVASYVLASASDGYQALFAIAELDPAFTAEDILVADSVDGKPLFDYQGPFRLVAPKDLRGARSVRMLQRLEVVRLRK